MKPAGGIWHPTLEAGQAERLHSEPGVHISKSRSTGTSIALKLAVAGTLLSLLAFPTFQGLWTVWSSRPDASHGFLIPLIAAVLIRQRWPELRRIPLQPSPGLGIPLILLSLAGLLLGDAGAVVSLSGLSFIGLTASLIVALFGWAWFRMLAFPLGYAVFMVPVLDSVTEPLQPYVQFVTATMARLMLALLSIPVFQSGTLLHLPTGTVEVAAECSGMGFLISILAIGLPLAMMGLRTWPMRIALIATTLVLSLGVNWMRVALIALSGHLWGWSANLHGPLHLLHAMSVYWIGLGFLLCGLWVGRTVGRRISWQPQKSRLLSGQSLPLNALPRWNHIWVATCLLMSLALILLSVPLMTSLNASTDLSPFPGTIGDWIWDDAVHGTPLIAVGQVDQELLRTYRNASGDQIQLHIVYLASQSQGRELINHRTRRLHQAASRVTIDAGEPALTVNRTTFEASHRAYDLVFWYEEQGRMFTDRLYAKLMAAISSLTGGGSAGALVLISHPIASTQPDTQPTDDALPRFTLLALPILQAYLP